MPPPPLTPPDVRFRIRRFPFSRCFSPRCLSSSRRPAFPHGFRPLLPAFRPSFETSAKDDQNFGCFAQTDSALHRLVRPATMALADFCQPLPSPLNGGSPYRAGRQTSQGKTCHFPPIYPPHLLPHPPDDYRALSLLVLSPGCDCLVCGSCSSGREFACGFLLTPRVHAPAGTPFRPHLAVTPLPSG